MTIEYLAKRVAESETGRRVHRPGAAGLRAMRRNEGRRNGRQASRTAAVPGKLGDRGVGIVTPSRRSTSPSSGDRSDSGGPSFGRSPTCRNREVRPRIELTAGSLRWGCTHWGGPDSVMHGRMPNDSARIGERRECGARFSGAPPTLG